MIKLWNNRIKINKIYFSQLMKVKIVRIQSWIRMKKVWWNHSPPKIQSCLKAWAVKLVDQNVIKFESHNSIHKIKIKDYTAFMALVVCISKKYKFYQMKYRRKKSSAWRNCWQETVIVICTTLLFSMTRKKKMKFMIFKLWKTKSSL